MWDQRQELQWWSPTLIRLLEYMEVWTFGPYLYIFLWKCTLSRGKLEHGQQSGSCFELSASCACLWQYSPWLVRLKDLYKCKTELESALESFRNGKEDARLKIAIDSRSMIKLGLIYFFWCRHCWIFMEKASTFSGL